MENGRKAICPFCCLQDGLRVEGGGFAPLFGEDSLLHLDYDSTDEVNQGSLCSRGNSVIEFLEHPQRLLAPSFRGKEIGWEEAHRVMKSKLGKGISLLLGPNLTLEEAWLAKELVNSSGLNRIAHLAPDDGEAFQVLRWLGKVGGPGMEEIERSDLILLVGDTFMEHPVISRRVLRAKYAERKNRLLVLDSVKTKTAWFADLHLQPRPGTEGFVLAGLAKVLYKSKPSYLAPLFKKVNLERIAEITGLEKGKIEGASSQLASARQGVVILSNLWGRVGPVGLAAFFGSLLASLSNGKFLHLPVYQNGFGISLILGKRTTGPQLLEGLQKGEAKGFFVVGLDLLSSLPGQRKDIGLKKLDHLWATAILPNRTTEISELVLPAASGLEKGGNLLYLNGDLREMNTVLPPPGGAEAEGEIFQKMAKDRLASPDEAKLREAVRGEPYPEKEIAQRAQALWEEEIGKGTEDRLPFYLIPSAHPAHLGNGAITGRLGWAKKVCAEPHIELSPVMASKLKLEAGDRAVVSSQVGKETFAVLLNERLKEDQVTVPAHFPQVRRLFPWEVGKTLGEFSLRPQRVKIAKSKGE